MSDREVPRRSAGPRHARPDTGSPAGSPDGVLPPPAGPQSPAPAGPLPPPAAPLPPPAGPQSPAPGPPPAARRPADPVDAARHPVGRPDSASPPPSGLAAVPDDPGALDEESPATHLVAAPEPPVDNQPAERHDSGPRSERSDSIESSGPSSGPASSPLRSRRTSSRSRSTGRGGLGAGLVEVPRVPYREPSEAVMSDPVVAEHKRYCGGCNAKVGRGTADRPGPTEGTCPTCGTAFSFTPRLSPGEIVGGQYQVLGALAYGGLGWIYLAQDHNVAGRWVVLKGLIDTGDETAVAAAVNETRYLAEVEHPNIVRIYNFVEHPDPKTGTTVGYIVMEYVGGKSLRQLAIAYNKEHGHSNGLPLGQVIAYGLEILPALGYLHDLGLLYCDLKPDNVIQTDEQLKLIDLGAVRHIDDFDSPLFFTSGYSAPELSTHGASVQSDLFTLGRTLAVLSFEFTGYSTKWKTALPPAADIPLFTAFESYYRFLRRATHSDPSRRFASAAEMTNQLTGVLREVMALQTGEPQPGMSTVFSTETSTFGVQTVAGGAGTARGVPAPDPIDVVKGLPVPMVDTGDSAAALLASMAASEPRTVIEALARAPHDSIEVRLRVVRARIELGELAEAKRQLNAAQYIAVKSGSPHDWRLEWYRGLIELADGRTKLARAAFDAVYDELPGEIAPKLAVAVTAEALGDPQTAAKLYEVAWRADRSYVSAAFGLARAHLALGSRSNAVQTLESIPVTSIHHTAAQVTAIKIMTTELPPTVRQQAPLREQDVVDASARLQRLTLDAENRTTLAVEVLEAAYALVRDHGDSSDGADRSVLGHRFCARDLRFGLERCYRDMARLCDRTDDRVQLVDKANAIRPRTLT